MEELLNNGFTKYKEGGQQVYSKVVDNNYVVVYGYGDYWCCNIKDVDDNEFVTIKDGCTSTWVLQLVRLLEGEGE